MIILWGRNWGYSASLDLRNNVQILKLHIYLYNYDFYKYLFLTLHYIRSEPFYFPITSIFLKAGPLQEGYFWPIRSFAQNVLQ